MERRPQLSEVVTQKILYEMQSGSYKEESRLPPEVEIAAYLGVSRTIIRDSLASLEREGFISRRHGVGTIINRHVLSVVTRMDLEQEFLQMIEGTGRKASVPFLKVGYGVAGEELAGKLKICPTAEIIQVTRIVAADDEAVIICTDSIAKDLIDKEDYTEEDLRKPIFDFLDKYCNTQVYMDLTEVRAVGADDEAAGWFGIAPGAPVLFMDEVGYTFRGKPVLHSREFYKDQALQHMVLRKKI